MRVHFFLVISSTCATYFWSNMATPSTVITSAFQLVEQKKILQFGSDISPLLKFHCSKYLPCSWKTWGFWAHRRAGECDPTSEQSWGVTSATTLHSCPCIHSCLVLPTEHLVCLGLQIWIWMRLTERTWSRLYQYGKNKEGKKIRKYKNSKSKREHAYNHNFAFIQFRYNGWWINFLKKSRNVKQIYSLNPTK